MRLQALTQMSAASIREKQLEVFEDTAGKYAPRQGTKGISKVVQIVSCKTGWESG